MPGIRICDLLDYPQHIPTISHWMWEEWDKSRGWTLEQSIKETESWCQRDAIPWGVVAVENDAPVGAMSFLAQDHDDHPDLTPWMACQYVVPGARGSKCRYAIKYGAGRQGTAFEHQMASHVDGT